MIIVFLGPPGSGKDTQAQILAENQKFTVVSGGEALREEIERNGPHAAEIKQIMDNGDLVPDEIGKPILIEYIQRLGVSEKIAFTGSVRRFTQIAIVDEVANAIGGRVDAVVYLKLSDEQVYERTAGRLYAPKSDRTYHVKFKPPKVPGVCDISGEPLIRRNDDKPESVTERLKVFHQDLASILEAYQQRGILHTVDASLPIPEVYKNIVATLDLESS
jgi:adenylate kinase